MDSEQDVELQRLTAQYVEEERAGLHPRLGDYIARYPQYADAIVDFLAYYYLFEADIPEDTTLDNSFSEPAQSAWNSVQQRILTHLYPPAALPPTDSIEGTAPAASSTAYSPPSRVAEQASSYQTMPLDPLPVIEERDVPE